MIYTVHIGNRSEEWPEKAAETPTRAEACRTARNLLGAPVAASLGFTKAEVRHKWRLLDCFTRKANSVQSVYSAIQRERK
jgi:hypothetical protein